jgi:hypothetical protein
MLQYKSIINQSICNSVYAKLKAIYVVRFWGEEQKKKQKKCNILNITGER